MTLFNRFDTAGSRDTRSAPRIARGGRIAMAALVGASLLASGMASGSGTRTYKQRVKIPVPPASNFAGSGGGDGWAVALTSDAVYNVFHHNSTLQVACHKQVDASDCWEPKTIQDASGNDFETSQQPSLHLDQASGHLFVYATRSVDATAGVACIDTTQPASNPNPFCGFTALSAAGEATGQGLGSGVVVGSKFYALNSVSYTGINSGTLNKMLCFDLASASACQSQPYAISVNGTDQTDDFPHPAAAIGGKIVFVITVDYTVQVVCFNPASNGNCSGAWPVPEPTATPSYGAPFPLLDSSGFPTGVCLPNGLASCFDMSGEAVATPASLDSVIGTTSQYNGPAVTIGSRVYVPNGNEDQVKCYDYGSSASCADFPHPLTDLGYLYTVNADPQRPACLWVNADGGSAQIQNFEAYSGGGCGEGPVRVLAASFVPPSPDCAPVSWTSLQVLEPARSVYSDGSVAFRDGSGNPIPGAAERPVDGAGTADLTGLDLDAKGLPQFLITLNGLSEPLGAVTVEVTWTGPDTAGCGPDLIVTTLQADPSIAEVLPGATVYLKLSARLTNTDGGEPLAGRTVVFSVGDESACRAVTAPNGTASCGTLLDVVGSVLALGYNARFDGDGASLPSTDNGPLVIVNGIRIPG